MNDWLDRCHFGDCLDVLRRMPDGIVNTCVTSPPYFGLRDYGHVGQIGLEATPDEFVGKLVEVFREVRRVLREDGTLWLNLGDTYATGAGKAASPGGGAQGERFLESGPSGYRGGHTDSPKHKMPQTADAKNANANIPKFQPNRMPLPGLKPKDLIGIPWMAAFALRADGWYLRQDIIWAKPNPMPESVTDRCTKSHEYIFLLSKSASYYCDMAAIKEPAVPGRTAGNVSAPKGQEAYEAGDEAHRTKGGLLAYAQKQAAGKGGKNAFRGQGHFRDGDNGPANREGRDMQDVGAGDDRGHGAARR
jgi:DNA modification methylase